MIEKNLPTYTLVILRPNVKLGVKTCTLICALLHSFFMVAARYLIAFILVELVTFRSHPDARSRVLSV